jgi:NADH-quinone oxidoreductase subunit E
MPESTFPPPSAIPNMEAEISQLLSIYARGDRSMLLAALQTAQDRFSYLPVETIQAIAEYLGVSQNEAYGVASFYAQFRFEKPGKHSVKVCLGTACHVRRGDQILDTFERELGVHNGQTTADGQFSLERVACFGCCALAPVVVVDEDVHARMRTTGVKKLLKKYEK